MKKLLLTLAAAILVSAASFSQTHSDLSENAPTASTEGYMFNFKGSDLNNCVPQHIAAWGGVPGTWSIDQTLPGFLQIVHVSTDHPYDGGNLANFY